MAIFKNEQAIIEERISEIVPQLEDVGEQARVISGNLNIIMNALKHPDSWDHKLFGSGMRPQIINEKFGEVKNELDVYAEKSAALVKDITRILTDIMYPLFLFYFWLIQGTKQ